MTRICWTGGGAVTLLALLMAGCSLDTPSHPQLAIQQPQGKAAAANYVACGGSEAAGFMDAGLHINGQINSFPSLVAWRLGYSVQYPQTVDFTQPWVAEPGIGSTDTGNPDRIASTLYWNGSTIDTVTTPATETPELLRGLTLTLPYENLSVPGALLNDVGTRLTSTVSTTGAVPSHLVNPYFDPILRNPTFGDVTMLGQVVGKEPTLVTLWIGNSDVLPGAASGEPEVGVNVTPEDIFRSLYESLVDDLDRLVFARNGIHPVVIVANILNFEDLPYFIPKQWWDENIGSVPTEEIEVQFFLFPAVRLVQDPGFTPPLGSAYTLDAGETSLLQTTTAAYNDHIAEIASARGLQSANLNEVVATLPPAQKQHPFFLLQAGMAPALVAATTVFSLDGIHLNNRGNLQIANAFISAINTALELQGSSGYGLLTAPISEWNPTYGRNDGNLHKSSAGIHRSNPKVELGVDYPNENDP